MVHDASPAAASVDDKKRATQERTQDRRVGDRLDRRTVDDEEIEPGLELFENGALKPFLIILKNGRHIQHLEGLATAIENGDVISIFPAVAGG